jgi:hypothetical protein
LDSDLAFYSGGNVPRPENQHDWATILDGIEALQKSWPELQKANQDFHDFGYGYVRIGANGFEHLPAHLIQISIGDPSKGAADTDCMRAERKQREDKNEMDRLAGKYSQPSGETK